ncbi:MATH and LRR domain-containing protein PFE0570w-like [Vespula maculifrons]|uniref:MATH and LRR domain-containing protein PFE0570w-like n=1 Tax=Vespula maculifrons TaxID=7453 RepID=A0ABD2AHZ1_VESMC
MSSSLFLFIGSDMILYTVGIMAITTDLLETDIVLFYSATSEWWYEAREYIPSKGPSVSRFGRLYNPLRSARLVKGTSDGVSGWCIKIEFFL